MKVKQMIVSSNARFIPTLLICSLYVIFWGCTMMLRHPQLRPDPRRFKFLLWRPWRDSQPYFIINQGDRERAAKLAIKMLPKVVPRLIKRAKLTGSGFIYVDPNLPTGWWWYPYEDQRVTSPNPLAVRLTPEEYQSNALARLSGWDRQPRRGDQWTSRLKVTVPSSADDFLDFAHWDALVVLRRLLAVRGMDFWIHEFCEPVLPHLGPGPFYVRLLAIDLNN